MHIVHVLHSLGVGGTEHGVTNLIGALAGEFRHTVISMTDAGPLAARLPAGVPVHPLGKYPGTDFSALVRLTGLLRRLSPDIVHSRNWGAFDAIPAARLAGVPCVLHGEHGREATDPRGLNPRRNRLRRVLGRLVTRFVTVSFELRHWLIHTVGIPEAKILTIHNGVDTRRFSDTGRQAGRRVLGLPPDIVVAGTVGRLDPVKDQVGLLEAFAGCAAAGHALVIVGEGPWRGDLEARARRPDLAGRVHLLGERMDVPALLRGFDLFVLPSLAEGISNTILEAMATGLPIIATRVGGNTELVEDRQTGTLVPVGDRAALREVLQEYLEDPGLRLRHGQAGRRRAVEKFGLERMVERYRSLYRASGLREAA